MKNTKKIMSAVLVAGSLFLAFSSHKAQAIEVKNVEYVDKVQALFQFIDNQKTAWIDFKHTAEKDKENLDHLFHTKCRELKGQFLNNIKNGREIDFETVFSNILSLYQQHQVACSKLWAGIGREAGQLAEQHKTDLAEFEKRNESSLSGGMHPTSSAVEISDRQPRPRG